MKATSHKPHWLWLMLNGLFFHLTLTLTGFSGEMSAQDYADSGFYRREHNDFNGAITQFTKAIVLTPNNDWLYEQRAAAREAKGDLDGAIGDWTEGIRIREKLNIPYLAYYKYRAFLKEKKGDLKGAIDDFTLALQPDKPFDSNHNPSHVPISQVFFNPYSNSSVSSSYYWRGILREAIGDEAGAITDFWNYAKSEEPRLKPEIEKQIIRKRGLFALEWVFDLYMNICSSYIAGDAWKTERPGMTNEEEMKVVTKLDDDYAVLKRQYPIALDLVFNLAASAQALELEKRAETLCEDFQERTTSFGPTPPPFKPITTEERKQAEKRMNELWEDMQKLPRLPAEEVQNEYHDFPVNSISLEANHR